MTLSADIDRAFAGSDPTTASRPADTEPGLVSRLDPIGRNGKRDIVLRATPIAELLCEPVEDAPWLVEGILPQGGLSILAGKPKAGKSTFARVLALGVARGDAVLGRKAIVGPVLYLGHEDKRSEVAEHFRAMGARSEPLFVHSGPAPLVSETAVTQLDDLIRQHGATLAIIDTLLRFVRIRDISDYAQATIALDPLLGLARDTGCHIMAVYHAGKAEREGLDGIVGSVAIAGSCDTGLILKRRADGTRTLSAIQRYGVDFPETTLELDGVTRGISLGEAMEVRARRTLETVILDALSDGELTEAELRESVGGDTGAVGRTLRRLVGDGSVTRDGKGRSGDPFRYRQAIGAAFGNTNNGA